MERLCMRAEYNRRISDFSQAPSDPNDKNYSDVCCQDYTTSCDVVAMVNFDDNIFGFPVKPVSIRFDPIYNTYYAIHAALEEYMSWTLVGNTPLPKYPDYGSTIYITEKQEQTKAGCDWLDEFNYPIGPDCGICCRRGTVSDQ
jgi:hypothetical protein